MYSQMGRFLAKAILQPEGHERRGRSAEGRERQAVANAARNTWVTETALTTALNVSYMAEQIALFGLVVGIALLLSGIGFIILALGILGVGAKKEKQAPAFERTAAGGELRRPRYGTAGLDLRGREPGPVQPHTGGRLEGMSNGRSTSRSMQEGAAQPPLSALPSASASVRLRARTWRLRRRESAP